MYSILLREFRDPSIPTLDTQISTGALKKKAFSMTVPSANDRILSDIGKGLFTRGIHGGSLDLGAHWYLLHKVHRQRLVIF